MDRAEPGTWPALRGQHHAQVTASTGWHGWNGSSALGLDL